jgi:hypothetical protein
MRLRLAGKPNNGEIRQARNFCATPRSGRNPFNKTPCHESFISDRRPAGRSRRTMKTDLSGRKSCASCISHRQSRGRWLRGRSHCRSFFDGASSACRWTSDFFAALRATSRKSASSLREEPCALLKSTCFRGDPSIEGLSATLLRGIGSSRWVLTKTRRAFASSSCYQRNGVDGPQTAPRTRSWKAHRTAPRGSNQETVSGPSRRIAV